MSNRELSEDDEATVPRSRKSARPLSPMVIQTNRPAGRENDPAESTIERPHR